jgi:hypothetical protein
VRDIGHYLSCIITATSAVSHTGILRFFPISIIISYYLRHSLVLTSKWPNRGRSVLSFKGAPQLHQQPNRSNYAELILGVQEGNPFAVANFRNTFTPGIQFFIAQESNAIDILDRVEQVVLSVLEEIRKGQIEAPNLPSRILESVRRNIGPRTLGRPTPAERRPVTRASEVAVDLLKAIPEREQEALKEYYVDLEAQADICAKLGLTVEQFRDLRLRIRSQFMNTWRGNRDRGTHPGGKSHAQLR